MPHFEIHVNDVDAAKTFYSGLFGWEFAAAPMGEDMQYHMIMGSGFTAPDQADGQSLTGGMFKRMDASPSPGGPIRGGTMTFEVADCDERYAWALANGGAEALPPTDMPGIGRFAYVEDGQGNVVGMIAPALGE